MFQNSKDVKGRVMRVSDAAVECRGTWVGMEEKGRGKEDGAPGNHLPCRSHPEPHGVRPLDYTQSASGSFFPQEENMAEYIIFLAGCKMGLD